MLKLNSMLFFSFFLRERKSNRSIKIKLIHQCKSLSKYFRSMAISFFLLQFLFLLLFFLSKLIFLVLLFFIGQWSKWPSKIQKTNGLLLNIRPFGHWSALIRLFILSIDTNNWLIVRVSMWIRIWIRRQTMRKRLKHFD